MMPWIKEKPSNPKSSFLFAASLRSIATRYCYGPKLLSALCFLSGGFPHRYSNTNLTANVKHSSILELN